MSEKLLDVKNLHTSFFTHLGEVQAIRDVSFGLDKGEIIGIVGESGSGKSVTSLSIMGLLAYPGRVKDGEILFNGEDLLKKKKSEMRKIQGDHIAMIFQDPMTSLNPLFKIGDQITEAILTHHKIKKEDAKKRALEMLKELNERLGTATILITHNLGCASSICDRIIVMYGGKIMEEGTTEEIFYEPHHPYTMGLLNSVPKVTGEASKERLVPILGTPPDMLHPPTGCPFYPRCKYAMKVCASMPVPEQYISDTHRVSCFMCHPQAPRNEEYESQKGGIRHAK